MIKVNSIIEIQSDINTIKTINNRFITNFYPEFDKLILWIEKGQFHKKLIGNSVFFFKKKTGFSYLYYCASSIGDLNNSLSQLKLLSDKTQFVVDIIGKEPDIQPIVQVFRENEFYIYTTLNRMSRSTTNEECKNLFQNLKKAEITHSEAIYNLLNRYFDPLAEQLPCQEEINNWIKTNHLIIIEEEGEILGFIIFDIIGVTSYLRYWFVHPQHRNKKLGSTLLHEFFKNSADTKRQLFWVIQTNENAICRYLHYGFHSENLYDFIMINKNIHYEATNN